MCISILFDLLPNLYIHFVLGYFRYIGETEICNYRTLLMAGSIIIFSDHSSLYQMETKVWGTFQKPPRFTLCFHVSVKITKGKLDHFSLSVFWGMKQYRFLGAPERVRKQQMSSQQVLEPSFQGSMPPSFSHVPLSYTLKEKVFMLPGHITVWKGFKECLACGTNHTYNFSKQLWTLEYSLSAEYPEVIFDSFWKVRKFQLLY